jgi:hypothetical protein
MSEKLGCAPTTATLKSRLLQPENDLIIDLVAHFLYLYGVVLIEGEKARVR